MKRNKIIKVLILTLIFFTPMFIYAQPNPGGDPENAPIDGGLSILIAAGIGYGVKKSYNKRKMFTEKFEEKE